MMNRALRFLSLEVRGLQRAVYVLGIFALFSSFLALARDRLFAHVFGAGTTLDLYNAAFRIPDLLFVIMGALVSVYILIPELSRRDEHSARDYIDTIVAGFSILCVVVCGAAALAAPTLLPMLFPKLVAEGHLVPLTLLTRIMLLQPVLLGFSNIFAAITQSRHRYLLYALSPVLYNFGIMLGAGLLYPLLGVAGLAWGVVLGALLHAGIQMPSIIADGFFARLPRLREPRALAHTVFVSVPRALALSMNEVAELGLVSLAGLLAPGSISIFFFAYNLQNVPVSVIGASYSVAAFPGLAAALARGERQRFLEYVATAARYVIFWSLPATALMIVLRAHVVRVILGSGAFNWTDTRLTAAAFALFGISLAAQGVTLLLVRAYYAAGRTFVPFFVSTLSAVATIALGAASVGALNVPFIRTITEALLRVVDVPGTEVLALAFAYAFAQVAGAILLVAHFETRFRGFFALVWRSWLQALLASLAGGAVAYMVLTLVGPITLSSTVLTVVTRACAGAASAIFTIALIYAMLGSREYAETLTALRGRIPSFGEKGEIPIEPDVVAAAEELTSP